ncbi:MAG: hypothetical protein IT379_30330 [Deltaproteobacteria bacterium]|nr:hypothetical protein [Deltaproteobacteria bacterium]
MATTRISIINKSAAHPPIVQRMLAEGPALTLEQFDIVLPALHEHARLKYKQHERRFQIGDRVIITVPTESLQGTLEKIAMNAWEVALDGHRGTIRCPAWRVSLADTPPTPPEPPAAAARNGK